MTKMFQRKRKKTSEKDEVIDMASECCYSVTMSDHHVLSQYWGCHDAWWFWRNL